MIECTVNGNDRTAYLKVDGTLRLSWRLQGPASASCRFEVRDGGWTPEVGQEVAIYDSTVVEASPLASTRIWVGEIDTLVETQYLGEHNKTALAYDCTLATREQLLTRRRIRPGSMVLLSERPHTWQNVYAGDIARDIVEDWLADENISVGQIDDGAYIDWPYVADYRRASEIFDDLALRSGLIWYLNDNTFHMVARTAAPAIQSLGDETANFRNLRITRTRAGYRNRVFVRYAGESSTDTFTGNGTASTWTLTCAPKAIRSIKLNGESVTYGVAGQDEDRHFTYTPGSRTLTRVSTSPVTVLTAEDTIVVEYLRYGGDIEIAEDAAEQASRAVVENATGIHEDVVDETSIVTATDAADRAAAELERSAIIGVSLSWESREPGWWVGQLVTAEVTNRLPQTGSPATPQTFLIDEMDASPDDGQHFLYSISARNDERTAPWIAAYQRMARQQASQIPLSSTGSVGDIPAAVSFSPAIFEYGVLSVEQLAVTGGEVQSLESLAIHLMHVDELTADVFVTLDADLNDSDTEITVTANPDQTAPAEDLSFAEGDYILFLTNSQSPAVTGEWEIARIVAIDGATWTIDRLQDESPAVTEAYFGSLRMSHAADTKIFKLQDRRFVFDLKTLSYTSDQAVPLRYDCPLPNALVAAVIVAAKNDAGWSPWEVYNCGTAQLPGMRTCHGGNYTFSFAGTAALGASPHKQVQFPSAIRTMYAVVKTAPTGADLEIDVMRTADGGATYDTLASLVIPAGEQVSYPLSPLTAPADQDLPYDGVWPTAVLAAGDDLMVEITQVGSTVAGADVTVEVFT